MLDIQNCDAPLGAVCRGVKFDQPLMSEEVDELKGALDDRLVLIFRGQDEIANHELVEFARHFGPTRPSIAEESRLPDFPEINLVSDKEKDSVKGTGGAGVIEWHSDLSFTPPGTAMAFLYAAKVPPPSAGGETKYVNLRAALEALDPKLARQAELARVEYRLRQDLGYVRASDDAIAALPSITHDLVQRTGYKGKKSIWPNCGIFDTRLVGVENGESLLAECFAHSTQEKFTYTHLWEQSDLVVWLNVATMHRREPFDPSFERRMYHVNVTGHIQ
jgi:alpha-ketoglutarate-dependent taurine dioxygenase